MPDEFAGRHFSTAAHRAAEEVSDRQIAINLTAPIPLILACLPHRRRQGGGRIMQVASNGGQSTSPASACVTQ